MGSAENILIHVELYWKATYLIITFFPTVLVSYRTGTIPMHRTTLYGQETPPHTVNMVPSIPPNVENEDKNTLIHFPSYQEKG